MANGSEDQARQKRLQAAKGLPGAEAVAVSEALDKARAAGAGAPAVGDVQLPTIQTGPRTIAPPAPAAPSVAGQPGYWPVGAPPAATLLSGLTNRTEADSPNTQDRLEALQRYVQQRPQPPPTFTPAGMPAGHPLAGMPAPGGLFGTWTPPDQEAVRRNALAEFAGQGQAAQAAQRLGLEAFTGISREGIAGGTLDIAKRAQTEAERTGAYERSGLQLVQDALVKKVASGTASPTEIESLKSLYTAAGLPLPDSLRILLASPGKPEEKAGKQEEEAAKKAEEAGKKAEEAAKKQTSVPGITPWMEGVVLGMKQSGQPVGEAATFLANQLNAAAGADKGDLGVVTHYKAFKDLLQKHYSPQEFKAWAQPSLAGQLSQRFANVFKAQIPQSQVLASQVRQREGLPAQGGIVGGTLSAADLASVALMRYLQSQINR